MDFFKIIKPLLFKLPAEFSHTLSLKTLQILDTLYFIKTQENNINNKIIMGLEFPNIIGLAAGLDKNADYFETLGKFGFGFIEVGTVTPKPQQGNPKPRLFRNLKEEIIVNRMGFNNKGIDYLYNKVKNHSYNGILGINIGKNKTTTNELAIDDYILCMRKIYTCADYITVNISSPNTKDLRDLQNEKYLNHFLQNLKQEQLDLQNIHNKYVPLTLKIAPDISINETVAIAEAINNSGFDAVIATNTTISRENVEDNKLLNEPGGLSGKPLFPLANQVLIEITKHLKSEIVKIGVGGITSVETAKEKLTLGADLIQVYSGFVFQGPKFIQELDDIIF